MELGTAVSRATTTIAPAIVAVGPWLIVPMRDPEFAIYYEKYPVPFHLGLIALLALVSYVLNAKSSALESTWDTVETREYWYRYLSVVLPNEPVGFRYISRMASVMKFELALSYAIFPAAVGLPLSVLTVFGEPILRVWIGYVGVGAAGLLAGLVAAWLGSKMRDHAKETYDVICAARREILNRNSVG